MIVARAPSGIPGLDTVIEGGFPTNSTIALRAEPSNATEYFQQQFIAEGLKLGKPAVYCCLSRPASSVIQGMKHQGFDVLEHLANDQLVILDCYSVHSRTAILGVDKAIHKKIISVTDVDDELMLQEGLSAAVERVGDLKGLRTVCENVAGTLTTKKAVDIMRWGRRAFADLRAFEAVTLHTFPVGVRDDLFAAMAHDFDSIIEIKTDRSSERLRFFLHIQKMRMTNIPHKMFEFNMETPLLALNAVEKIT